MAKFNRMVQWIKDIQAKNTEKLNRCLICNKEFTFSILRDFHHDVEHNLIEYSCPQCIKWTSYDHHTYYSIFELYDHLYVDHDIRCYEFAVVNNILYQHSNKQIPFREHSLAYIQKNKDRIRTKKFRNKKNESQTEARNK